jgi:molybdopterin synthase sulfur carrier subunit
LGTIVRIFGSLREVTQGKGEMEVVVKDIADCLDKLEIQFPGVKKQVYNEQGELERFFDIFVNGNNVRLIQGLATPLKDGDEVSILPAIAGG